MIGIVSYGLGNVRAFANIYERFGVPARIVTTPEDLRSASRVILPGVGAFDWAMQKLAESGLRPLLDEIALKQEKPILGVCVGMQMMVERSQEGAERGLAWMAGECASLRSGGGSDGLALPHMGWNDVDLAANDPLFEGIERPSFYFLHSFHVVPHDGASAIAHANYGRRFVCAMRRNNVVGVQFHPEKSHHWGERLLLNFASS